MPRPAAPPLTYPAAREDAIWRVAGPTRGGLRALRRAVAPGAGWRCVFKFSDAVPCSAGAAGRFLRVVASHSLGLPGWLGRALRERGGGGRCLSSSSFRGPPAAPTYPNFTWALPRAPTPPRGLLVGIRRRRTGDDPACSAAAPSGLPPPTGRRPRPVGPSRGSVGGCGGAAVLPSHPRWRSSSKTRCAASGAPLSHFHFLSRIPEARDAQAGVALPTPRHGRRRGLCRKCRPPVVRVAHRRRHGAVETAHP